MKHSFLLLILLSSSLVVSQDSLQSALSKESNSSSQASNRQESINLLDINLITLKGDIQFLNPEKYPVETRISFLKAFLKVFEQSNSEIIPLQKSKEEPKEVLLARDMLRKALVSRQ